MENPIEKFDPSTLMQGVKDRIKATFVSLIPEAQWETMVQKEIDAFFEMRKTTISKKTQTTVSYGQSQQETTLAAEQESSPFRDLVWEHCSQMTIAVLKEKINKEYFTNTWAGNQRQVTDGMKEIINQAAPLAAAKFFESVALGMVNELQQRIQNARF